MKKKLAACLLAFTLAVMPGASIVSGAGIESGLASSVGGAGMLGDNGEAYALADNEWDIWQEEDMPIPDQENPENEIGNDSESNIENNIEDDIENSTQIQKPDNAEIFDEESEENQDLLTSGEEEELFTEGVEEFSDAEEEDLFSSGPAANALATAITSCKGYSAGQVRVTVKIPSLVRSKDKYYYLFQVDPNTNKLSKKVSRVRKPEEDNASVTFKLNTSGHPEYVMSKYALAAKTKSGSSLSSYTRISGTSYVSSPEKAAADTSAYAVPKSKKGLQTTSITQLTETKSKTAFINLPVSILLVNNAERVTYTYNGKKYNFNKIGGYTQLVSQCNQKGIQVTMQIMLDWTSSTKSLTASGSQGPRSAYYAWNTTNAASRQKMEALFSFVSELFGSSDCYVSNWILGNEVNTYSVWNYPGNMSKTQYVANYSETFRYLYNAVRSKRASSKAFICLDHYWNHTGQGYAAKDMMDSFARKVNALQPGVNWNLAYHAYPFPLTDPRFWSGSNSNYLTNNSDSTVISLNNLSVLTNYVKKNYGTKTRVILSEQGFTSTKGQDAQAAAVALGYYIAACNPMIDAFIIRSYQDEGHEVAQGLAMGIKGKKAFKVFLNMDSSKTLTYTSSYLKKQVGSKWTGKVLGYNKKRLYTMYRTE